MKIITQLTIKRSKWLTPDVQRKGESFLRKSFLLNQDGRMCCLGFAVKKLGATRKKMLFISYPFSILPNKTGQFVKQNKMNRVGDNSELSRKATSINDSTIISNKVREKKLTRLFKSHGIVLTFVD